jgi:hypothetical protein
MGAQPKSKRSRIERYDLEGPSYYNLTYMNRQDPAIIAGAVVTDVTNMRLRTWGLEPRQGYAKHNTTAIQDSSVDEGLWLFPFDKGFGDTPRFMMGVSVDGRVFYSTTPPPTASDFTELYDAAAELSNVQAVSVSGRCIITTDGTKRPLCWYGDKTDPMGVLLECDDDELFDYTNEAIDGQSDTYVILDSMATTWSLFIITAQPIDKIYFTVASPNGTASVMSVKNYTIGGWGASIMNTDGTADSGKTLAQTGTVTLNTHTVESMMKGGIPGFLYSIEVSVQLDAEVEISAIQVHSPVAEMQDAGDKNWDLPLLVRTRNKDYTREVTDFVELEDTGSVSHAPIYQYDSGGSPVENDMIMVGSLYKFDAIKFIVSKTNVLDGNGDITVYYRPPNSSTWTALDMVKNTTNELSRSGFIHFVPPAVWQKVSMWGETPMYIVALAIGDGTPDTDDGRIVELRIRGCYQEFERWKRVSRWGNRAVYFNRQGAENQVVISAEDAPEVITGPDAQMLPVGPRQPLVAAVPFYHELWMASEDKVYLLWNNTPPFGWREYGGAPEGCVATNSARSVELPDGSFVVIRQGRTGVFMFDGKGDRLIAVKEWSPFFDQNASGCINKSYIDKSFAWITRDSEGIYYNLAITTGSNTKHDTVLVYNVLTDRAWYYTYSDDMLSGCFMLGSDGIQYEYLGGYGHAYKVTGTTDIAANFTRDFTLGCLFPPDGFEHEVPILHVCGKPEATGTGHTVTVSTFEDGAVSDSETQTFDLTDVASEEYILADVQVAVDSAEEVRFKFAAAAGKGLTIYSVCAKQQRKRENYVVS